MTGSSTTPPHTLPYLANCSLLFTEWPLLQRADAAAAAGFAAVEFWWPFATSVPSDADVDAFVASIANAGVKLMGLNFFAGDLAGSDCGLLSVPGRSNEFRDNIDVAIGIGSTLGTRVFNALYGVRVDGATPDEQDELALECILLAASAARRLDATVLIEPISGPKPYPLRTADQTVRVVDAAVAAGADKRRLPLRPLPPGCQRGRSRQGGSRLRREDRACSNRRCPRTR